MGAPIGGTADRLDPVRVEKLQRRMAVAVGARALLLDLYGRPLILGEQVPAGAGQLARDSGAQGTAQLRTGPDGLLELALPVFVDGASGCVWLLYGLPAELGEGAALTLLKRMAQALTGELLLPMRQRAGRMMLVDRVCGLPDARSLERDLAEAGRGLLVVVDIQDLHRINEMHGREFGDELLRALCAFLQGLPQAAGQLYRLDTADFGLLLPGEEAHPAQALADALEARCREPWELCPRGQRKDILVAVHVGAIAVDGLTRSGLHHIAGAIEYTLNVARRTGQAVLPGGADHRGYQARLRLERELRDAVEHGMRGFSLAYQPLVDPGVATWRGVEALCRWQSASFGTVPPTEFIPLAEDAGLIGALGDWVLDRALEQVKDWGIAGGEGFLLGVNLSPVQLADPELGARVRGMLERHGYPPDKLCLELTGTGELGLSLHTLAALERLGETGVQIALDNFGGGYAALGSLGRMPASILKVDRALIRELEGDEHLQRLFGVIVELAHGANMKVVAEGVETDGQAQMLLGQGADLFQGYRFAGPIPAGEVAGQLEKFARPLPELVDFGYARMDLSRLSDEQGGYQLTPALYKLLNQCMRELFSNPDGNAAIDTALARIGQALGVSRSYVFLKESDGTFSNTHEWCADGVPTEKDSLQHCPIIQLSPGWIESLMNEGMLVASDITTLEPGAYQSLAPQGIRAVAEFPIWNEGELFGFVGFDDCERNHVWSREEVQMLHTLTGIITATLGKLELQEKLRGEGRRLENMLNAMDTMIYVSDLETNRILFANDTLQRMYGQELTGQVCWEVLHRRTERCEFCPIPFLISNPGKSYQWEFYNEVLRGHFRIRDSIIPWEGGTMAHFEYAENITELMKYHKRLEAFASTDMLTGTLNRSSFETAARVAVEQAVRNNLPLTLAFVDIDGLKAENDHNGHAAGDRLILNVVQALRGNVRATDQIGRYGGDEFVVLFAGCDLQVARSRIDQALRELEAVEQGRGSSASFSYGLAGTREIGSDDPQAVMTGLLQLADQRMMTRKRQKKRCRDCAN